jgi:hypothetical protein
LTTKISRHFASTVSGRDSPLASGLAIRVTACAPRRQDRRDGGDCLFRFDSVTGSQSVAKALSLRRLRCFPSLRDWMIVDGAMSWHLDSLVRSVQAS